MKFVKSEEDHPIPYWVCSTCGEIVYWWEAETRGETNDTT